ncbi:MAG: Prolipoprotein diacylglyceryl transferase [Candidatus Uhrbacteria bacterium GW2011_GWA2_52_8d]|uniref:Phosphatidylglycerol--prolipoprotein diacylglyceryl transferase n=1 Tax=Candidatus Uhrbacteria bacterium GW2011_GWA2_52_8d TaxID=1618979 RepID=A0A0G1XNJ4_9BACT|nr:MAG: Prolipoprotein diacylglyceryl transferase [Candidatus Uhrbacteria bacterium GW2011_GWA2_52_8d]
MLPYFAIEHIALGPFTIHVWGLMVALGLLAGAGSAAALARRRNLDPKVIWDATVWIILGAFVGARLFHVLFYEPTFFFSHPGEIIAFWNGGLSLTGGLIGGIVVGMWTLRKHHVDLLAYADVLAFGLPLGTFIGRIGCFLAHLHPGKSTNFFLGVLYPDGVVRHDLGLYLSLDGLFLFLIFLMILRHRSSTGSFIIGYLLWYGLSRFLLDFLRATDGAIVDTRYFWLTPAQYFSLLLFSAGLIALWKKRSTLKVNP